MHLLYNIGIYLYGLAIAVAAAFNPKAKLWVQGRKNWREQLKAKVNGRETVWVHCASLGEFEQARPVIEQIKHTYPNYFLLLTFFSPSGYEIRKNYEKADAIMYLPLDTPGNAKDFIEISKPKLVLFVKYEFWINYLTTLHRLNIPAILFSATFRPTQVFFKAWGGLFRKVLKSFAGIYVQNSTSKSLLKSLGIDSTVAPDTRFDRVLQIAAQKKSFPLIEQFKGSSKLLIAGSTWAKDKEFIRQVIEQHLLKGYKYIIAPHNIVEDEIELLAKSFGSLRVVRLSQLNAENATGADVLIVDSIGYLSSIYAYGEIAYVGGAFGVSVHNVLEPAVYGLPVLYGPNHTKANEAIDLLAAGGGFTFTNQQQLNVIISKLADEKARLKAAEKSRQYVLTNQGGTDVVMSGVGRLLQ